MKRACSLILIALLLLCPVLSSHADGGQYVFADSDVLSQEQLETVNAHAAEIAKDRGVGIYYFYYYNVEDLPAYIEQFAAEHVTEQNALVLGFNSSYYYFLRIGSVAEAAFPDSVCDGPILDAYRAVKGDPERKLLAYLNAADDALASYLAEQGTDAAAAETDLDDLPSYIARTAGGKPTLVDRAHLLSDGDAALLSQRLKTLGDAYQCDVVIVTVEELGGKSVEEYAEDFFSYNGYGYGAVPDATGTTRDGDGVILLLSMAGGVGNRDCRISTSGFAITAFTDYGIQIYLEPLFLPYFRNNRFAEGFDAFADGCDFLLKTARAGEPYDVYTASEKTANGKPILVDQAGLLSTEQIRDLSGKLRALGDKYRCDMIFVTDVEYSDGDTYAANYYRKNGYGYRVAGKDGTTEDRGGILAFYSPITGQLSLYTEGFAKKAFQGRGLYLFRQELLGALYRDSTCGTAAETFATRGGALLEAAQNGRPYNPINWFPIALAVIFAGLAAFIPVNGMKRKLTDVGKQTSADSYMEPDSFQMTQNSNVLLGTNVTRTVHVVQTSSGGGGGGGRVGGGGGFHGGSSTHTSSSGGTFGGHSSKF